MTVQFRAAALAIASALILSACSGVTDPSKNQVETFSGALAVAGHVDHNFSVGKTGEMTARLTSISPNAASLFGVGLGVQINGTCAVQTANNVAGTTRDALSTSIQKGSWCVQVFDNGTLTATQNYTIQVSHP